jgi:hypothetical protein
VPGVRGGALAVGLDRANESQPVVPFVSVLDALDPGSPAVEDELREGVTTLGIMPGNDTQVGGQGIVVRPFGRSVEEMLVRRAAGLKISLEPRRDTTRAGQLAALRRAFREAREGEDRSARARAEAAATPGEVPPMDDARRGVILDLLEGRIPAFCWVERAMDVRNAFTLLDEHRIRGRLVLGPDAWRASDLLRERQDAAAKEGGSPVLFALDPEMEAFDRDEDRDTEEPVAVAGVLHRAGVRFALTSDDGSGPSRHLWYQAARAVRQGVPRDEAIRSITIHPARFLGVDDRVGSLEKGKDANLLVLTGDPLSTRTWVDSVVLDGRVVYERAKDRKLKRLREGERREDAETPAGGGR